MANLTHLTIKVRWWVWPYLRAVVLFARIFNCEPSMARVESFICRYGLVVKK